MKFFSKYVFFVVGLFVLFAFSFNIQVQGAWLTSFSDTITTSNPSVGADHIIKFTATNGIPASGKIIITPEAGQFNIPASFDYIDVDFTVNGVQRPLAAIATATEDGVATTSGTSGNIEITLNSATGVSAGEVVDIVLGNSASFEFMGDIPITNPSGTGSYTIFIETQNSASGIIDKSNTIIAIVTPIAMDADATDTTPPVRFNGLPTGELPAGITNVEISLETDEFATCSYDTVAGTDYSSMPNIITNSPEQTLHSTDVSTQDDTTYNFYIRCKNAQGLLNPDDFLLTFSIKETPESGSTPGGVGDPDVPPVGGSGGAGEKYPPDVSIVGFSGRAFPGGVIVILADGVKKIEGATTTNGGFDVSLSDLGKGVYTFVVYGLDKNNNKTDNFSTTFTIRPNTSTVVAGIFLAPTISASEERVEVGEAVVLSGYAFPNSAINVRVIQKSASSNIKTFRTDASSDGAWNLNIDTEGYVVDSYRASARSIFGLESSDFGLPVEFGVGTDLEKGACGTADLNCDGFVNLIDFSILLFWWNTDGGDSDPSADINSNGKVELADFSIMLFNWTG